MFLFEQVETDVLTCAKENEMGHLVGSHVSQQKIVSSTSIPILEL